MTRSRLARWSGALLLLVLLVAGGATRAGAHAVLVAIDPADGARLDEAPTEVVLTFNERVSAALGGVRVLDADGAQVQRGAPEADGETVTVALEPDLPDGSYTVSYRVLSADGHPVRGATVFGIGEGELDEGVRDDLAADDSDRVWNVVGAIGRALAYGGTLLAAGGALFLAVVDRHGAERARLAGVVRVAAVIGAAGALVTLPVQAALGTGQGPSSLTEPGVLGEVAAEGVGLGVALTVLGLVAVVLLVRRPAWPAAVAGGIAVLGFATSGHTRSGYRPTLATTADVVHLLVAAAWAGGIVLLALALRWRRQAGADQTETVAMVGRFSTLATVTVLLVGVSGLALGWIEVGSVGALTTTTYGKVLLAKASGVAAIAAIGAYNHLRLIPAIRSGKATAGLRQLGHTLRLEAILLVAVVALTAVLVVVTPSRTLADGGIQEAVAELSGGVGSVQVTVAPAEAGFNQIHLYLFDADGRPAEIAQSVQIRFSLPEADLGPFDRDAVRAGPAHFQLDGSDLSVAGDWELEVLARVDRFTEATGTVEIPIAR